MAGRLEWRVGGGRLHARIGMAESEAEVFDPAQNQLRVELTGGGTVATFVFEGDRAVRVDVLWGSVSPASMPSAAERPHEKG